MFYLSKPVLSADGNGACRSALRLCVLHLCVERERGVECDVVDPDAVCESGAVDGEVHDAALDREEEAAVGVGNRGGGHLVVFVQELIPRVCGTL